MGAKFGDKRVCTSIFLSVCLSLAHLTNHMPNFTKFSVPYMLPVAAAARSSSDDNAMFLQVLWMTPCCDMIGQIQIQLECGPMSNVMVALPNTGGALCSTPQSLTDVHY